MQSNSSSTLVIAEVEKGKVIFHKNELAQLFSNPELELFQIAIHTVISQDVATSGEVLARLADHCLSENTELNQRLEKDHFVKTFASFTKTEPKLLIFHEPVLSELSGKSGLRVANFYLTITSTDNHDEEKIKIMSGIAAALSSITVLYTDFAPIEGHFTWFKDVIATAFKCGLVEQLQNVFFLISNWQVGSSFKLGYQRGGNFYADTVKPKLDPIMSAVGLNFAENTEYFVTYTRELKASGNHKLDHLRMFFRLVCEKPSVKRIQGCDTSCEEMANIFDDFDDMALNPDLEDLECLEKLVVQQRSQSESEIQEISVSPTEDEDVEMMNVDFRGLDELPWDLGGRSLEGSKTDLTGVDDIFTNLGINAGFESSRHLSLDPGIAIARPNNADISSAPVEMVHSLELVQSANSYEVDVNPSSSTVQSIEVENEESVEEMLNRIFKNELKDGNTSNTDLPTSSFASDETAENHELEVSEVSTPYHGSLYEQSEELEQKLNQEASEIHQNKEVKEESQSTKMKKEERQNSDSLDISAILPVISELILEAPLSNSTNVNKLLSVFHERIGPDSESLQAFDPHHFLQEVVTTIRNLQVELNNTFKGGTFFTKESELNDLVASHAGSYLRSSGAPVDLKQIVLKKINQVLSTYLDLNRMVMEEEKETFKRAKEQIGIKADQIIRAQRLPGPNKAQIVWTRETLTATLTSVFEEALGKFHPWMLEEVQDLKLCLDKKWRGHDKEQQIASEKNDKTAQFAGGNKPGQMNVKSEVITRTGTMDSGSASTSSPNWDFGFNTKKGRVHRPVQQPVGPFANINRTGQLPVSSSSNTSRANRTNPHVNFNHKQEQKVAHHHTKSTLPIVAIIYNWENIQVFIEQNDEAELLMRFNHNHVSYSGNQITIGQPSSKLKKKVSILELAGDFLFKEKGWRGRTISRKDTTEAFANSLLQLRLLIAESLGHDNFEAVMSFPPFMCQHLAGIMENAFASVGSGMKIVNHFGPCMIEVENSKRISEKNVLAIFRSESVHYTVAAWLVLEEEKVSICHLVQCSDKSGYIYNSEKFKEALQEISKKGNPRLVHTAIVCFASGNVTKISLVLEEYFPELEHVEILPSDESMAESLFLICRKEKDAGVGSLLNFVSLSYMKRQISACTHKEVK